jgi:hypothetical protein
MGNAGKVKEVNYPVDSLLKDKRAAKFQEVIKKSNVDKSDSLDQNEINVSALSVYMNDSASYNDYTDLLKEKGLSVTIPVHIYAQVLKEKKDASKNITGSDLPYIKTCVFLDKTDHGKPGKDRERVDIQVKPHDISQSSWGPSVETRYFISMNYHEKGAWLSTKFYYEVGNGAKSRREAEVLLESISEKGYHNLDAQKEMLKLMDRALESIKGDKGCYDLMLNLEMVKSFLQSELGVK